MTSLVETTSMLAPPQAECKKLLKVMQHEVKVRGPHALRILPASCQPVGGHHSVYVAAPNYVLAEFNKATIEVLPKGMRHACRLEELSNVVNLLQGTEGTDPLLRLPKPVDLHVRSRFALISSGAQGSDAVSDRQNRKAERGAMSFLNLALVAMD